MSDTKLPRRHEIRQKFPRSRSAERLDAATGPEGRCRRKKYLFFVTDTFVNFPLSAPRGRFPWERKIKVRRIIITDPGLGGRGAN
jgi:hypothetical protein